MEFPPAIGFFSWLQNLFNSDSVYIHHLSVYIASAFIYIFCGLITIKLGGSWRAVLLVMSCILISPNLLFSQQIFQPVIFNQLFWVVSYYMLVCYFKTSNNKYLLLLGIMLALGFLTKYSIVFLISGLFLSVLIFERKLFKNWYTWAAVLIFLIMISPNIFWQISNDFPVFLHFSRLYEVQLNHMNHTRDFWYFIKSLNLFTFFVWFPGIFVLPFLKRFKEYKLLLFTILFSFIILLVAKGKSYYFLPMILMGLCWGAIYIESLLLNKKIILEIYILILLLTGIFIYPRSLPLMSMKKYISKYQLKPNDTGVTPL